MQDEIRRPITHAESDEADQQLATRFLELVRVLRTLRGPDGCPWDRKQTPDSLKRFLIEEAHEVVDAIDRDDASGICEELGDLLFQILFQARIQEEAGSWNLERVLSLAAEKMVRRHPHVFGDARATTDAEIRQNWNRIKRQEKDDGTHLFDSRPTSLPALMHCHQIGQRAASVGFDWDAAADVLDKVREEIDEVIAAQRSGNRSKLAEELGDLLFAVGNWVRHFGLEPEAVLTAANRKFINRFCQMERLARGQNLEFEALSMDDKERLWQEAKKTDAR